jgi:hypothetical protein
MPKAHDSGKNGCDFFCSCHTRTAKNSNRAIIPLCGLIHGGRRPRTGPRRSRWSELRHFTIHGFVSRSVLSRCCGAPAGVLRRTTLSICAALSRSTVSGEHLGMAAHLLLASLPSNPSSRRWRIRPAPRGSPVPARPWRYPPSGPAACLGRGALPLECPARLQQFVTFVIRTPRTFVGRTEAPK